MKEDNEETLCQHSTIELKDIAEELKVVPMAVVGQPQIGKSTLAKHLIRELSKLSNVRIRVWDSSTKHLFNSAVEKVFVIPQPNLVVYSDTDAWQPNEMIAYSEVLNDSEMEKILQEKCICFDTSEIDDIMFERMIQQRFIHIDKKNQIAQVKRNKGHVKDFIVWCCEESQGVFSSNSLRRKENLWLAKCISTSANYGISWLIITRRASEVSTKIFEHSVIKAIGNSNQPNSLRKLKQILKWQDIELMKTFGKGQFLILNNKGTFYLKTEKFKGNNPIILEPQPLKPKQNFKSKIKGFIDKLLKR